MTLTREPWAAARIAAALLLLPILVSCLANEGTETAVPAASVRSGFYAGGGSAPAERPAGAGSDAAAAELAGIWEDPVFKRQFVASYGVNAEIEPRVTPEEVAILEKIRPLM